MINQGTDYIATLKVSGLLHEQINFTVTVAGETGDTEALKSFNF